MLIIGHRGAAGLAPENTLDALWAGYAAGSDMLEFDIRITKDAVPILAHNPRVGGRWVSQSTLDELREVADVATLHDVLKALFGKILLNIEIKQPSSVEQVLRTITPFIKRPRDWDNVLFSSFKPKALSALRDYGDGPNLALLQHINPFAFMRHHKQLNLSAVGFHRLHVNSLALETAKELGIFTYAYTINRSDSALRLEKKGVDGIVTDYPDKFQTAV